MLAQLGAGPTLDYDSTTGALLLDTNDQVLTRVQIDSSNALLTGDPAVFPDGALAFTNDSDSQVAFAYQIFAGGFSGIHSFGNVATAGLDPELVFADLTFRFGFNLDESGSILVDGEQAAMPAPFEMVLASPTFNSVVTTELSSSSNDDETIDFLYRGVPSSFSLGDGSTYDVNALPSSGNANIELAFQLDADGILLVDGQQATFSVVGETLVGDDSLFTGTLLQGDVVDFEMTSIPGRVGTVFSALVVVTGGEMAQQPEGFFRLGRELVISITQTLMDLEVGQEFTLSSSDAEEICSYASPVALLFPSEVNQEPVYEGPRDNGGPPRICGEELNARRVC